MVADCVFCSIVKRKSKSYRVFEDNDFLAFLEIRPLNPGDTLVIPKKHYRWVWDVPNVGEYFEVCKKIVNALRKTFKTDWIASLVIGADVPHAHVRLIPRFPDDGHGGAINFEETKSIYASELKRIAYQIAENL